MKNIKSKLEFLNEGRYVEPENLTPEQEYDRIKDLIEYFLEHDPDINDGHFGQGGYWKETKEEADKDIKNLRKFLKTFPKYPPYNLAKGYDLDEFMTTYWDKIMKDDFFTAKCGFFDYLLYSYDNSQPLGGALLEDRPEDEDIVITYYYGYQTKNLGRLYILQSYNNMNDFYYDCAKKFPKFIDYVAGLSTNDMLKIKENSIALNKGNFSISLVGLEGLDKKTIIEEVQKNNFGSIPPQSYKYDDEFLIVGFGENVNLDNIEIPELEKYLKQIRLNTTMRKYNL